MSLIYLDSFDSYSSFADMTSRWGGTGAFNWAVTGRSGIGRALSMTWDGNYIERDLGANESVIYIGFAFRKSDSSEGGRFISLFDSGTEQCGLSWADQYQGQMQLAFRRGASTKLATAPRIVRNAKWYYVEAKFTISNTLSTAGLVLKVNGETWLQVDSGDSQTSANAWANVIRLNARMDVDDLYILNSAGSAPYNTFLGDIRVDTLRPNGNGTTSNFVGSDADSVDNYLHVDEVDPDGDTTYIESAVASALDLHTIENLPVTPATIFGVQPVSICKKTDAGARTGRHVLRTGATNYESADFSPSNASYLGFAEIWEENPNTALPWIEADIHGLESGLKVQS